MTLVHCYNKGCGQKFDPGNNEEGSCRFHPKAPYFHDAQKIWQCCDKKSTDFGTFLSIPGCTTGKHSNQKPDDIVRLVAQKEIRPEKEDEVIVWNGLNKPAERPSEKGEEQRSVVELPKTSTEGLKAAIQKFKQEVQNAETDELKVGTKCANNGCESTYNGPESLKAEDCQHHPGQPVFHEGMKYYDCCNRKTSNFSAFLEQKGCTKGKHNFTKASERVDRIKEDWFCRSGEVHFNVYCRGSIPEDCKFECDGYRLKCFISHAFGEKQTEMELDLFGKVVPEESSVLIAERKVEIILKQADNLSWPELRYVPDLVKETQTLSV
ncbi:unnamed protein product [Bursaphelenchus xylophilus]|uniref:(pine wood nematode) hypothetical protein n=1 Tax=Bursaphelenchus xylophilus TaxID=6326 RepID=A0A1I7RLC8_BURXY|nr:unnamed protein product [Bursaphelenchus xylophilus]CAG9083146.1 unnamed protein product [Bursaphelenchus xylophilus]